VKITEWYIEGGIPGFYVQGITWGHPRYPDGGPLHTSSIRVLDLDKNKIQTLNSVYELENTKHKQCLLGRVGGDLCCLLSPVIRCDHCLLLGCKVCFTDTDALFVETCNSPSKLHTWNILGVK